MAFENLKSTGIKYVLTKLKDYFLQIKDAVKSVNGEEPDETGDITINTVPYAQNLESESSLRNYDTFVQRTAGGDSSISNGEAWLMALKGNSEHTGYTPESISMTVTAVSDPPITATLDRDTFVETVETSGTTTLVYTTEWSADPATYGVTVTGDPASGDTITIVYVKEVRGLITVANPTKFSATGWNLYDHTAGYAKVVKYEHGYRVSGTYTALKFSATPTGTQTDVSVTNGNFNIPSDGFIHVTGGNATDTAIYATWDDWTESYAGDFVAYEVSEIDLSSVMETYFPYGLLKAGDTVDELNLNLGQAISRVDRLSYTAENLAIAKNSGREYEYDENFIYLAKASASSTAVTIDGSYETNDHGIEFFTGSDIAVAAELLYGNNLKNKLERDVLTISQQSLTNAQKAQVLENIGAGSKGNEIPDKGRISSGDWNKLTAAQRFYYNAADVQNWANKPFSNATTGVVITAGTWIIQIAIRSNGAGFVRVSWNSGSTWGNWSSISGGYVEVSGTTSAAGTLQISDLNVATHRIVSIIPSANVIAVPVRWGNTASSKWGISFRNYSDYSAVANTEVSAVVYYEYL